MCTSNSSSGVQGFKELIDREFDIIYNLYTRTPDVELVPNVLSILKINYFSSWNRNIVVEHVFGFLKSFVLLLRGENRCKAIVR